LEAGRLECREAIRLESLMKAGRLGCQEAGKVESPGADGHHPN